MLTQLLYILIGVCVTLFRPRRALKFDRSYLYIGRDSVWRIGPKDWQPQRISESVEEHND